MAPVVSARYIPHDAPVATLTNPDKTTDGRDSTSTAKRLCNSSSADMSEGWNPNAQPFRPSGHDNRRRNEYHTYMENQPPAPMAYPAPPASAPWSANYAPPYAPPQFYNNNQQAYNNYGAQAQPHPQAQAYYNQWQQQQYGYPGNHPVPQSYGMQPYGLPSHYGAPPPFWQQSQQNIPNRAYYHTAMQSHANLPYGARHEDMQYAFDALIKGLKSKKGRTNAHDRASTPPANKSKPGAAVDGQVKQKETPTAPKGRYGDTKIMLPAPQPTPEYLAQTAEEPSAIDPPSHMLVILDLNGTVLYRPNRNAKTMIERPFLRPFLRYLFQNFKVMVWSSAKPDNVKSLVNQALDNDLRSKLIAQWARDSFGLSPTNYNQNVQVYKNLKLVWSRDQIQQHHPEYAAGGRFGQHNTVLIDDSALKANAQPHNLLQIPDFSATPEQMEGDALREVAGYLQMLRQQSDVSKFMKKEPFTSDGRWGFEWPDEVAGGGEMTSKVSAKKQKKKKKQANGAAGEGRSGSKSPIKMDNEAKDAVAADGTKTDASTAPVSETIDSLSSVSLAASVQKDW